MLSGCPFERVVGADQLRAAEPLTAVCVVVVAAAVLVVVLVVAVVGVAVVVVVDAVVVSVGAVAVDVVVVLGVAVVVVVDAVVVSVGAVAVDVVVVLGVAVVVVVDAVVVSVGAVAVEVVVVVGAGSGVVDVVVAVGSVAVTVVDAVVSVSGAVVVDVDVVVAVVLGATTTGAARLTVTSNLPLLRLPEKSADAQFTDVVPGENTLPETGAHWTVAFASTRSLVDTAKLTGTPALLADCAVIAPGRVIAGATVSRTLTVKFPVTELPARSRALQTTDVEPRAKTVPLVGVQVTLTFPSTLSVAMTVNHTVAPFSEAASTLLFAGSERTGGVLSVVVVLVVVEVLLPVRCASAGTASTAVRLMQRAARRAGFTAGMGNS